MLLRIAGALTAPTSMALTCRWRSRPQHQKRTLAPQQTASLFDHLVGGDQQARRNGQAKCLRRFEVDDGFELRRRLHRKVGGLCATQDAVNISRRLSIQVDEV